MQLSITKGYEGSDDEERVKDVRLEGEESQAHVGEDEVLRQEVQQLEKLKLGQREKKKEEKRRVSCGYNLHAFADRASPDRGEETISAESCSSYHIYGRRKNRKKHFLTTISEIFAANAGTICS